MSKLFVLLSSVSFIVLVNLALSLDQQEKNYVIYLIKFLSPDTIYPVILKDKRHIHPQKVYDHTVWYQHHKKTLAEISKLKTGFFGNMSRFSNETLVGNDLLLLKYEKQKNLLDHYEPIHFFKENSKDISYSDDEYELDSDNLIENINYNNKYKKIYTLAYYDDLEISIDDFGSELRVECILDITMPKFLSDYHRAHLEKELKSLISFRIKFEDDSNDELKNEKKDKAVDFTENSHYLQIYRAKAGPFIFKKNEFNKSKIVCELLLKDYDLTNVLRKRTAKSFLSKVNNFSNRVFNFSLGQINLCVLVNIIFLTFNRIIF